jgi:uncharacterized protein DUF4282
VTASNPQQKSFFASLFDFGFTSFITLRFLKVIYTILVVLILFVGAIALIVGLASGSAAGVLLGLILAPLLTLFYLIMARVWLEVIAMFFRIGDNTSLAVQLLNGANPGQPGYGAQPGPSVPWGPAPTAGAPFGQGPATPYAQPTTSYGQPTESQAGNYGQHAQPPEPISDPGGQQGWGPTTPSQ